MVGIIALVVHGRVHRAFQQLDFLFDIDGGRLAEDDVQQGQGSLKHDWSACSSADVVRLDGSCGDQTVDDKVASSNRVRQGDNAVVGEKVVRNDCDIGGRYRAGFPGV